MNYLYSLPNITSQFIFQNNIQESNFNCIYILQKLLSLRMEEKKKLQNIKQSNLKSILSLSKSILPRKTSFTRNVKKYEKINFFMRK